MSPANSDVPRGASVHLAQINVARGLFSLDHPAMVDFVALIDSVNAIADADPGLVWRLKTDNGQSSSYVKVPGDDRLLINLTVWHSVESLKNYVYRSHQHARVFRDRRQWFEDPTEATFALWWIPAGDIPSLEEGFARLELLRRAGPTADAFTFKITFPPTERVTIRLATPPPSTCGAR